MEDLMKGDLLAQGINCFVRVDMKSSSGTAAEILGLVQNAQIRKSINVQRAEVIGHLLPVSIDPTGIQVSVSLKGFIPRKGVNIKDIEPQPSSDISAKSFNPDDENLINNQKVCKIPYLDLYDKRTGSILGSSNWLIVTSYGDSVNSKGYVEADLSLEGIGYQNGTDYASAFGSNV